MIISGGMHMGCMKLVGEAFKDNTYSFNDNQKITVLGITNWRTVRGNESLVTVNVRFCLSSLLKA